MIAAVENEYINVSNECYDKRMKKERSLHEIDAYQAIS